MRLPFDPRPLPLIALMALSMALGGCASRPAGPVVTGETGFTPPGSTGVRAASLVRMGDTALRTGDPTTAAGLFQEALILDDDSMPAALGLGNALLAQGRPQDAAKAFERGLAISAESSPARYGYARAMLALRRPEVAATHLERIVQAQPGDTLAINALGVAYSQLGRNDLALATYRRGLAADPTAVSLRNNLGLALALAGRYDEAIDQLRPLGEGPQATRRTRQNLALAYGLKGDFVAARRVGRIDLSEAELDANLAYVATVRGMQDPSLRAAPLAPLALSSVVPDASPTAPAITPFTPDTAPPSSQPRSPRPLAEVEPAAGPGTLVWYVDLGRDASAADAAKRWQKLQERYPRTLGHREPLAGGEDGRTLQTGPFANEERAARACVVMAAGVPNCKPFKR